MARLREPASGPVDELVDLLDEERWRHSLRVRLGAPASELAKAEARIDELVAELPAGWVVPADLTEPLYWAPRGRRREPEPEPVAPVTPLWPHQRRR